MRLAAGLLLLALTFAGCESNQERSAHLAKLAHHERHAQSGLSIAHASAEVKVVQTAVLHSAEGTAVVVGLRNVSAHDLHEVPIAITVTDASGRTLFQNNSPGLEAALTSLASLPAHGEATWVDDQVQASGTPARVSAIVGEAPVASRSIPRVEVAGVRSSAADAAGGGVAGTVRNRSAVTQQSLVVYVLARRAGKVLAAGRAVLPEVAAGTSMPFQAFLVGTTTGAKLEASAPPTTLP